MKEYIEREAAINKFSDYLPIGRSIRQSISEVLVADVAPVVHGEWKKGGGLHYCSNCGNGALHKCIGSYSPEIYEDLTPYCPNCGAKMDGGNE